MASVISHCHCSDVTSYQYDNSNTDNDKPHSNSMCMKQSLSETQDMFNVDSSFHGTEWLDMTMSQDRVKT